MTKPAIFRTLRFRMAAAFFLWTGIFQLVLTLLVPGVRELHVIEAVDQTIRSIGNEVVDSQRDGVGTKGILAALQETLSRTARGEDVFVELWAADGTLMGAVPERGEVPTVDAGEDGTAWARATLDHPRTIRVQAAAGGAARRVRVGTATIVPPTGEPYQLRVGHSLGMLDYTRDVVYFMLLASVLMGIAGAGFAGWLVSGLIVSRIDGVARAVREVSPTRLDERIELPTSDDEIGRMAGDVNGMLERMAAAFRSQERFMSEVSHELKTPVAAIMTEAQVLKYRKTDLEAHQRFVLSVEDEMRWLGKLVESFLMLARFGHGKLFLADGIVPVNDVTLDAVEHAALMARQHGITLRLSLFDAGEDKAQALIRGDAELLRVVIDNLIRNAVQFSKRGDAVEVSVDSDEAGVVIAVRDHGPGVPAEHLDRIFERFQQAPGANSTRRGSGLGLTIAKGVVDLHGGTIGARNVADGGCVFEVRLPCYEPGPRSAALTAAVPTSVASGA